jgi:hypothetical protein
MLHYGGVSTCCRNGGDVHLQEFRRVGRTIVLLQQMRPELGWLGCRAEMIRERDAAHAGQWDTRRNLGPSMFRRRSRALSRETQASSPACLRLSSARRSSVYAPLTEGERTDVVAS